jgi:hypothetical protein
MDGCWRALSFSYLARSGELELRMSDHFRRGGTSGDLFFCVFGVFGVL